MRTFSGCYSAAYQHERNLSTLSVNPVAMFFSGKHAPDFPEFIPLGTRYRETEGQQAGVLVNIYGSVGLRECFRCSISTTCRPCGFSSR